MKMITHMKRTVVIALLAVFAALSFSSCVRDEEPIFEESASVRLQKALTNAQTVLVGAENGWKMLYYPDPNQSYGGFLYTMKFTQEEVEIWSELFDGSSKSLYKMTTDDGPVLSFDTGNYNFHYFATPSGSQRNLYNESGRYQAYKGDFEFMIVSATKDEVVLKGKRSGNRIVMYPLAAGESPEEVANAVYENAESVFVSTFTGTIGSEDAYVYLYLGDRWASIELTGEQYAESDEAYAEAPYMYTENGLLFYEPVTVGPYTIDGFVWDSDAQTLTARSGAETAVSLQGQLPAGWHAYEDFLGTWDLTYRSGSSKLTGLTIEVKDYKQSYTVKGMSPQFDVTMTYDLSSGTIRVNSQTIGEQGSNTVVMAAWSALGSSSRSWTTSYGMVGTMNEDGTENSWADNPIDAFITWYLTSGGSSAGQAASPWVWANNSTQLWGWVSFNRQ